jgi:AcrR family transcriptional regulator
MRTKSEARKQAILDTASQVFQEVGFERASMSLICQRLGYSKATLYNYFPSKEALFLEVAFQATEAEFQIAHAALDVSVEDLGEALRQFGGRLLQLIYSPRVQAMLWLIHSEAGRDGLGRKCHELGPQRSQQELAAYLQLSMDLGKLPQADARIAALHLVGLLQAEWSDAFMFRVKDQLPVEERQATVTRAVAAFLRAYGPAPA